VAVRAVGDGGGAEFVGMADADAALDAVAGNEKPAFEVEICFRPSQKTPGVIWLEIQHGVEDDEINFFNLSACLEFSSKSNQDTVRLWKQTH
jgi:hypothetical protein